MDQLLFIFIRILYEVLIVLIVKIPALDGSRPSIVLSPPMAFLPLVHRPSILCLDHLCAQTILR